MSRLRIGIIGCGVIADIYCRNTPRFADIEMRACADLRAEAAEKLAGKYDLTPMTVSDLLASPDVDIVLNLTIPAAHADVSMAALGAGKHVYTEKPLATSVAAARELVATATERGLRIAAAPDTVLGAAGREARRLIDSGRAGRITAGTAFVLSRGMEHWHPSPAWFFQPGAGPVFDMGPYYLTQLVQLLGPVLRVAALAGTGFTERLLSAEGPLKGTKVPVGTPTTLLSLLDFAGGSQVMFGASWDVSRHSHRPFELYGTEASLRLPDPNFMGGTIELGTREQDWQEIRTDHLVFGQNNYPLDAPRSANDRGLGLAEMARAINEGRPQRLSARLALHVTAVMESILRAGSEGRVVTVEDAVERPAPLGEDEAASLLRAG
ncbi:MAG TPA: Gfo/Idh/MocA family oxidoreductase [Geminicoccaceae bacterium]|nr:Gfo/Idh/MocA family oxidoreductase [Geminicoccus sp.]HMU49954.1 Gfo/Idh/MocA family oxidoreductase [Geminicoccaceae bacterium]